MRSLTCLALTVALAGCGSLTDVMKSAPRPSARVVGANLQGLTLEHVEVIFDVEVTNPYPANLPLLDLSYALASNGQQIVAGGVKPSSGIAAHSSKVLQIPASIRFSSLIAMIKGVRPGSWVPYTADFKIGLGAPVIGLITLPLSHQGEVPIPAVPEVSLSSFDVGALSFDKVDAVARVRIKNTNQFDVDIARLGFNLALGGQPVAGTNVTNGGKIPPGQEGTLAIPITFSPRDFGVALFNVLRGSESGYAVSGLIESDTRFGALKLPFDRKGSTHIVR